MSSDAKGSEEGKNTNQNEVEVTPPTTTKPEWMKPVTDEDVHKPKLTLPGHIEPTYYVGGGNGNAIIESILDDIGWRRIKDKSDDTYTMKWCELKQTINYNTFREGSQMANHIPNCNLLTNKLGLLNSLQEYDRVCGAMKKRMPKLDFIPETLRIDSTKERDLFKELYNDGDVWICKPTGRNQGKGIFLVKNQTEADEVIQSAEEKTQSPKQSMAPKMNRIIQRYIHNPLLINKKKFDIRCYMLVGNTSPFFVLYHPGYVRLSMHEYDNTYDNLAVHLTNQFIQKKDPKYKDVKDETVMSMEAFNDYVNENVMAEKGIEKDWILNALPTRIKQIMTYCFNAVKHRLQAKMGYFELYGLDFMIDEDMKIWLIEVNVNPCLATNCEVLKQVVPYVVRESLYIAIECFDKCRKGKDILPCSSIKRFEIIYQQNGGSKKERKSQSVSPVRRPRTSSPMKEVISGDTGRRAQFNMRPGIRCAPTPIHSINSRQTQRPSDVTKNDSSHVGKKSPILQNDNAKSAKDKQPKSAPMQTVTTKPSKEKQPKSPPLQNDTTKPSKDKQSKTLPLQTDSTKSPKEKQLKLPEKEATSTKNEKLTPEKVTKPDSTKPPSSTKSLKIPKSTTTSEEGHNQASQREKRQKTSEQIAILKLQKVGDANSDKSSKTEEVHTKNIPKKTNDSRGN